MKTSHILEVTAHPYSLGSPRIYYAEDYAIGSTVVNNGTEWVVKYINGVCMFVSYGENEKEIAYIAKKFPYNLKVSYRVVKDGNAIVGYIPMIKYISPGEKARVLWAGDNICTYRDLGPNSAAHAARMKILEIKSLTI